MHTSKLVYAANEPTFEHQTSNFKPNWYINCRFLQKDMLWEKTEKANIIHQKASLRVERHKRVLPQQIRARWISNWKLKINMSFSQTLMKLAETCASATPTGMWIRAWNAS